MSKKRDLFVVDIACESRVTIINVIIFKNRLKRKNSSIVMKYSWSRLTDQFEYFLRQKQADTNNGLFVIDSSQRTPELENKEAIRRRVRVGSSRGDIRYVIEDPIFVESRRHNLIQLADMIAYMAHKYYGADRVFENWFKSLKPKMYRHNGRLIGFGIVEFPDAD